MRYLSVCSGIDAATVAWRKLGWKAVAFSEIDKFPSAVLNARFSDVPNLGDMQKYKEWDIERFAARILVGGTPCQSFSVAGLRKGLDDPRGNLALVYLGIAERFQPEWLVWENVPGVLSSGGGRDFGSFLGALVELGYGFAYRVLDAQYFGVPQRRRRVFVVGYLGDWRPPAAVLFERDSLLWNPEKGQKAKQDVARTLRARAESSYRADSETFIAGTLNANGKAAGSATQQDAESGLLVAYGGNNTSGPINVATAVRAKGGSGHGDFESETFIACTLPASVVAIQERASCENPDAGPGGAGFRADGKAYTLEARSVPQAVAFDTTQITSKTNRSQPQFGDPCHPLTSQGHAPAIAFNARQDPDAWVDRTGPLDTDGGTQAIAYQCHGSDVGFMGTLRSGHGDVQSGVPFIPIDMRQASRGATMTNNRKEGSSGGAPGTGIGEAGDPSPTISVSHTPAIAGNMAVRRLTPLECERLQGFPDGWTLIEYRGKPAADGPRYKAIGNSMAVPVMRWIGERIQAVSDLLENS